MSNISDDLDCQYQLHGRPAEHLQFSWRESGGDGELEVKNSFLTVSSQHKQLPRSRSWSGFSSGTSGQESSSSGIHLGSVEDTTAQPAAHFIFEAASDSASGSEGVSQPVGATHQADVGQAYTPEFGWSEGAKVHEVGKCSPCIKLFRGPGCDRGESCHFCHLSHDEVKRVRRRPCKASRNRCKRLVDQLDTKFKDDPEAKENEIQRLMCNHPYVRSLLMGVSEQGTEDPASASHSSQIAVPHGEQDRATGQNLRGGKNQRNLVSL